MDKIRKIISENEPNHNISIYKYNDFKELAKLTLKFRTYYNGGQERKLITILHVQRVAKLNTLKQD